MSMIPFFPSLRPSVSSSICIDVDLPCDDETELRAMEEEHVNWLQSIQKTGMDVPPFGKETPVGGAEQDTDDEGNERILEMGNDDSEDSDSHDVEEEDDMDASDTNQTSRANSNTAMDTASYLSPPDIFD